MTHQQKVKKWKLSLIGIFHNEGELLWAAARNAAGSIGATWSELQLDSCGIGTTPARAVNNWIEKHAPNSP